MSTRLSFGVGGTRQHEGVDNPSATEFAAYGLPLRAPAEGIARLVETVTVIRRMWVEEQPFDVDGRFDRFEGLACEPKPVQRPGPPVLLGGWGDRTLGVVAEHADIWNIPGPPHNPLEHLAERSRALDRHCAAIGRDPATITRSTQVIVGLDDLAATRDALVAVAGLGFTHIVLAPLPPYPDRLVDEVVLPVTDLVAV